MASIKIKEPGECFGLVYEHYFCGLFLLLLSHLYLQISLLQSHSSTV